MKISNHTIGYFLLILLVCASTCYGMNQVESQALEIKELNKEMKRIKSELDKCQEKNSVDI